jgi:hypothetical protein
VISSIHDSGAGEFGVDQQQPKPSHSDLRQEFHRLTRQYMRLSWSMNAKDQQERAVLNRTLMTMYCALNPNSKHFWYEDFDVVLRNLRRAS